MNRILRASPRHEAVGDVGRNWDDQISGKARQRLGGEVRGHDVVFGIIHQPLEIVGGVRTRAGIAAAHAPTAGGFQQRPRIAGFVKIGGAKNNGQTVHRIVGGHRCGGGIRPNRRGRVEDIGAIGGAAARTNNGQDVRVHRGFIQQGSGAAAGRPKILNARKNLPGCI